MPISYILFLDKGPELDLMLSLIYMVPVKWQ